SRIAFRVGETQQRFQQITDPFRLMIRILIASCAHRTVNAQQAKASWLLRRMESPVVARAGATPLRVASLSGNSGPLLPAHARPMRNNSSRPGHGHHALPMQERYSVTFRNHVGPDTF